MEKNTVTASCIKKYVKVGGKYNNEVYVLDPGDEWGNLYLCRNCGEIVYSYHLIQDVNQKPCPKCNTQAENNFVDYPKNIMLDGRLHKVDDAELITRSDDPTEVVSFPKLVIKGAAIKRDRTDWDTSAVDKSLGKNIKDGWGHLFRDVKKLKNKANKEE